MTYNRRIYRLRVNWLLSGKRKPSRISHWFVSIFLLWFVPLVVAGDSVGLQSAYQNKFSSIQVSGSGIVIKLLPDDNEGSRHQKFILKTNKSQTVLVAHNINLAPRISAINIGDPIQFYSEYEWNSRGGVIHWTHHDPSGKHEGGWLKHNGTVYK